MRVFGRILKHFVILKILAFFYLFLRTYDIMIIYLNVVIYLKKETGFRCTNALHLPNLR